MNLKSIIETCVLAGTVLLSAQSAQAADIVSNPLAPVPADAVPVKQPVPAPPSPVAQMPVKQPAVAPAPPVMQTPAYASTNSVLYRQLDELRSQNALLAESLKNAELKNKISTVGTNPSTPGNQTPGAANGFSQGPGSASSAPATAQVLMVSGSGTNLTATISLPTGGRVNARVGSNIAGLGVVKSIARDEVVVGSKTQPSIVLPFANETGVPSFMPGPVGVR